MKGRIIAILEEIVDLLRKCDWEEKADWFLEVREQLSVLEEDSAEFQSNLESLSAILAGMGSFSDLPLYPSEGSSLTDREARRRQWELAASLGEAIREFFGKGQ